MRCSRTRPKYRIGEPEFAAYQRQVDDAKAGAHASLLDKTMRTIRRREEARYRDARKNIRAEETERIDGSPIFKALRLMKDQRISREWVRDEFGEDALGLLPVRVPPLHTPGGVHPDAVAEQSGYASGKEMIEALIGAERAHRQAKEGGDTRNMRERAMKPPPTRNLPGALETRSTTARSNRKPLARFIPRCRARSSPRKFACWRERLASVQSRIASLAIRPGARFVRGPSLKRPARRQSSAMPATQPRPARAAEQAFLKQDVGEAFRQKQFQMLNNALLAEAKEAGDEVAAAVKRMDKIARARTRKSVSRIISSRPMRCLKPSILKERTQKSITRQGEFKERLTAREAEGHDVVVPPSFEATIGRTLVAPER